MSKTVACPTCGKPVTWTPDAKWRPFCSERCRLIDLGDWIDERRRIDEPAGEGCAPADYEEDGPPH